MVDEPKVCIYIITWVLIEYNGVFYTLPYCDLLVTLHWIDIQYQ